MGLTLTSAGRSSSKSGGSGASFWTPVNLGVLLALWLDADDSSTIILNGSNVSQWSDKSANSRNLTQTNTANQPAYISSGLNGRSIIRSIDSTDFLNTSTATGFFTNVNNVSCAIIAKYPTSAGNTSASVFFCSTGSAATFRFGMSANPSTAPGFFSIIGRRTDFDSTTIVSSTTPRIANNYFIEIANINYSIAQANHWTNGTQDITSASFSSPGSTSNTNPANMGVFGAGFFNTPAETEIAEVIAIHGSLSNDDRQKIEGYLAHKWNVNNLPVDHPYKSAPPII
jgi:hypothetical protein